MIPLLYIHSREQNITVEAGNGPEVMYGELPTVGRKHKMWRERTHCPANIML